MSDAEFIASLREIHDPVVMLAKIVENESFLGYDPYYCELRAALLDNAQRVVEEKSA